MNPDCCVICNGEDNMHNTWMGKSCPRAKPLTVSALKAIVREALSGSAASQEIRELERMWRLRC